MIRVYDTKSRCKQDFEAHSHGMIKMYVCGPTVYNYVHIGNARTFISFDVIRRYLMWRKFDVVFIQNITDIDDKIIAKATEEGCSAAEVAKKYTQAFIEDMHAINVMDPTVRPKATEEIPEMINLVEELIESGHAYEAEGDVYFDVRSYDDYGALSGRNVDEMEAGHRELRASDAIGDRKRDPLDFAVWKAAKPGEPAWDSPWGQGRPGWHLECSTMARKYLGLPFDIHGGGADLVFPHHENERAQAEAISGQTFANYWLHGGMLQINSEKMSKSLGNFKLLRDVLKTTDPAVLRFLMLQTHYRSPLDFSSERLAEAQTALERMKRTLETIDWALSHASGTDDVLLSEQIEKAIRSLKSNFIIAMDDDFNTPKALGELFDFITEINSSLATAHCSKQDVQRLHAVRDVIVELVGVFGINLDAALTQTTYDYPPELIELARELANYEGSDTEEAVDALLTLRAHARVAKNWDIADAIRDRLLSLGLLIEDTPEGARISHT